MNVTTCYRCPERHPDPLNPKLRCPILQSKLNAVKGAGLSSISFKCERRTSLFTPGDIVSFALAVAYDAERGVPIRKCVTGYVIQAKGRKFLVYCERSNNKLIWLYPDGLTQTGKVRACIHCGAPEGIHIRYQKDQEQETIWTCTRATYNQEAGYMEPQPCVFGEAMETVA